MCLISIILLNSPQLQSNIKCSRKSYSTKLTRRFALAPVSCVRSCQSDVNINMPSKTAKDDGDELARWVFGIARIYGQWPFSNKICDACKLSAIRITICDCIRLFLTLLFLIINAIMFLHTFHSDFFEKFTFTRCVSVLVMIFYISSIILNILISIWHRHSLLRIISINRSFGRTVSFHSKPRILL